MNNKNKIIDAGLVLVISLAVLYVLGIRGENFIQLSLLMLPFSALVYVIYHNIKRLKVLIKSLLLRRKLRKAQRLNPKISSMNGREFEHYVEMWLNDRGYKTLLTEYYDVGVDIIAEKDDVKWGVQVKRWNRPVGITSVRQVVAALGHYRCSRAMVVTNSIFYKSAKRLAAENNCVLIDAFDLHQ